MRTLQGLEPAHPMLGVEIGHSIERKVVMFKESADAEPMTFSPFAAREMIKNLARIPGLTLPSGYEPTEDERAWLVEALTKAVDALEPL